MKVSLQVDVVNIKMDLIIYYLIYYFKAIIAQGKKLKKPKVDEIKQLCQN
jgi:hypothetical protein